MHVPLYGFTRVLKKRGFRLVILIVCELCVPLSHRIQHVFWRENHKLSAAHRIRILYQRRTCTQRGLPLPGNVFIEPSPCNARQK